MKDNKSIYSKTQSRQQSKGFSKAFSKNQKKKKGEMSMMSGVSSHMSRRNKDDSQKLQQDMEKYVHSIQLARNIMKYQCILEAIHEDNLKIYKKFREPMAKKLEEMSKDRIKILKRMKTQAYKKKRLKQNTRETLLILLKILGKTVLYYSKKYFQSNHDRQIKLKRIQKGMFYDEQKRPEENYKNQSFSILAMTVLFYSRQTEMRLKQHTEKNNISQLAAKVQINLQDQLAAKINQTSQPPQSELTPDKQTPDLSTNTQQMLEKIGENLFQNAVFDDDKTKDLKLNKQQSSGKTPKSSTRRPQISVKTQSKTFKDPYDTRLNPKYFVTLPNNTDNPIFQKVSDQLMSLKDQKVVQDKNEQEKQFVKVVNQLLNSAFIADKNFALDHLVQISRDELQEKETIIESIFYDDIFNLALSKDDPKSMINAYEILCNLMESKTQRDKLVAKNYLKRIYQYALTLIDDFDQGKFDLSLSPTKNTQSPSRMGDDSVESASASPSPEKRKSTSRRRFSDMNSPITTQKGMKQLVNRILLKVSWLTCLIAYNVEEMFNSVESLQLFYFIRKILDPKNNSDTQANGVLAIALLSYNRTLFKKIQEENLLDQIMDLCKSPETDEKIKLYASQVLVHYSFDTDAMKLLIDKGLMSIFPGFNWDANDHDDSSIEIKINTNVTWIFQALCNHKIKSKDMLQKGITRDMFLVACNPKFKLIRHLVITSFAQLGRYRKEEQELSIQRRRESELQVRKQSTFSMDNLKCEQDSQDEFGLIQSTAVFRLRNHVDLRGFTKSNINILLSFASSEDIEYQYSALQTLKDFIFLNHKHMKHDPTLIFQAFLFGCISPEKKIQLVCANAISFIVINRLVYKDEAPGVDDSFYGPKFLKKKVSFDCPDNQLNVLDSLMYLSSSDDEQIRSLGFSALSALANFASQHVHVLHRIHQELEVQEFNSSNQSYYDQVIERLIFNKRRLDQKLKKQDMQVNFSGLYCLCRLAYGNLQVEIKSSIDQYLAFIEVQKKAIFKSAYERHVENNLLVGIRNLVVTKKNSSDQMAKENIKFELLVQLRRNEMYFNSVFKTLMNCQDQEVLIKMLKVVHYYSQCFKSDEDKKLSGCWEEVINSDTVLWILNLIKTNISHKYLCCVCSLTLLNIVENHSIKIDMHEGAIKRAYSKIFQKMEVFTENGDDNEEQVSDSITSKSSQLSISSESENQMVSFMQPNNISNMPSAIEVEDIEDYTNLSKLQQNSTNFDQTLLQNLPEQLRVQQQQVVSRSNPLAGEIHTGENELQIQSESDRRSHIEYLEAQSSPRHSQNSKSQRSRSSVSNWSQKVPETFLRGNKHSDIKQRSISLGDRSCSINESAIQSNPSKKSKKKDNQDKSENEESQDSVQIIQRAEPQADPLRRKLTVQEKRNHFINSKTKSSIINVAMRSGIFFKQKSILFQSTKKVVIEESLRQVQKEASVQVTDSQQSKRLVSMKQFRSQLSAQNYSTESPINGTIESPIHEQSRTEKSDDKESSKSISSGSDSINLVNINQNRDKPQVLSVPSPHSKDTGVANVIDQIWQKYDTDGSGDLDKQETKKFMIDSLQLLGTGEQLSDEAFNQIYDEFDIDKSGAIEKNEMENFVQKILNSRSYSSQQVTQALKERQSN